MLMMAAIYPSSLKLELSDYNDTCKNTADRCIFWRTFQFAAEMCVIFSGSDLENMLKLVLLLPWELYCGATTIISIGTKTDRTVAISYFVH